MVYYTPGKRLSQALANLPDGCLKSWTILRNVARSRSGGSPLLTKASAPEAKTACSDSGRALRTITLGFVSMPRRARSSAAAGRPGSSHCSKTSWGRNSLTCAARLAMSQLSRRRMGSDSCTRRDCSAERTRASLSATKMRICWSVPTRFHLSPAFHRTSMTGVDAYPPWPWSVRYNFYEEYTTSSRLPHQAFV